MRDENFRKAMLFMESVRDAERELKMISARRRHYEDLALSMGSAMGSVTAKPSGASRVESAAIGLLDLITDLDVKAREYVDLIRKAELLIAKLPQEKFRQVLTLHYLAGMSMKSINDEMGYKDEKSAYRCRKYALMELQGLM